MSSLADGFARFSPPADWKREGSEHRGPCPVTGEGKRRCWVVPDSALIGCHGCGGAAGKLAGADFAAHARALGILIDETPPQQRKFARKVPSPPPEVPPGTTPELVEWCRPGTSDTEIQAIWRWADSDNQPQQARRWRRGMSKAGLVFLTDGPADGALILTEGAKCAKHVREKTGRQALAFVDSGAKPTAAMLGATTGRNVIAWPDVGDKGAELMDRAVPAAWRAGASMVLRLDPARLGLTGDNEGADDWSGAGGIDAVRAACDATTAPAPGLDSPIVSEHHLAELWVQEHGTGWRWQVERDVWMRWTPDGWLTDRAGVVLELAGAFGREHMQRMKEGEPVPDPSRGGKIATARAVITYGRAMSPIPTSSGDWDAAPDMIGLPNGRILEVKKGVGGGSPPDEKDPPRGGLIERQRTPDDLVSRSLAAMPSNEWESSVWSEHLLTLFNDQAVAILLQRLMGYALLGRGTEDRVIVSPGNRACGKTVTYGAIMRAAGGYGKSIDPGAIISHRVGAVHPVGRLAFAGARIAVTAELATGAVLDADWVKRLSGGEECIARGMRENETRFMFGGLLAIHTNHAPELLTPDDGLKRRLLVIPFRRPRETEDVNFDAKIRADDVVGWLLEGTRDYLAYGFGEIPGEVQEETKRYHAQADTLSEFVGDELVMEAERTAAADIYKRYETWCREQGMKHAMTARTLNTRLVEGGFGVRRERLGGTTWLVGCRLA